VLAFSYAGAPARWPRCRPWSFSWTVSFFVLRAIG
jgi:hypothetical protein